MKTILKPLLILLLLLLVTNPLQAYNYTWSTHEDITSPNDDNEPGECEGSECEGEPDPCGGRTGSPVYLKSGHFTWQEIDMTLAGTPNIQLKRNYTSHEPRSGLFGNGWISNLERSLVKTKKIVPDNTVYATSSSSGGASAISIARPIIYQDYYIFRHPNGLRYTFKVDENGTLTTPRGLFESVEIIDDDTYAFNYPDGTKEVYGNGNLITREDKNANKITLLYDNNALLQQVKDDNGRSLSFYYNAQGYVSDVNDHTGRGWHYEYDTLGNLIGVTNPMDGKRSFEYSSYKPPYDAQVYSQITKITDENGNIESFVTYNGERVATYTEGENRFTYEFDFSALSATKKDSLGSEYEFNWDKSGLVTKKIDPLNNSLSKIIDENLTSLGYIDQANKTWSRTVDEMSRTLTKSSPLGVIATYTYEGANPSPSTITSALGSVTTITYDEKYNVKTVTDAKGNTQSFTLNAQGKPTAIRDAKGSVTTIAYNSNSQPTTITDALGRVTTITYDALARAVKLRDAKGNETAFEYDLLDRVVKTTNALGHVVGYEYNAVGYLTSLTDPIGNVTRYKYDAFGRTSEVIRPDGKITTYNYRADNLISSINRYDGKVVSFTYDAAKRLLSETVDGDTISFSYDARGMITNASNTVSTLSYVYDSNSRLISSTQNGIPITYSYNSDSYLSSYSFLGNSVNYTRDAVGLATNINNGVNNFGFTYDANSVQSSSTLPNGITESLTFNAVYELTQISSQTDDSSYSYDNIGLLTEKTINTQTTSYTNDAIARLTQDGSQTYTYDAAGNNQNNAAIYDTTTNQLLSTATHSFTYDSYGNLSQKVNLTDSTKTLYTWNARNQLIKVEKQDDTNVTIKTLEFTYDALGRRASKTTNNITQNYLYDGQDIIAILDDTNNPISIITHDESIDTPLSIRTNNENYFYQRDKQGSILNLTDSNQNKVQEYTYTDAYGTTTKTQTLETNNPYAYTGRELDEDDLYYYRARYYDPTTQRFLSQDPIGFNSGDFNFYRYVGNSPGNFVDPFGLAQTCYRPLSFLPSGIYGVGTALDRDNNVLGHQHIFFDDGTNIGFGSNGAMPNEDIGNYSYCEGSYDDAKMKDAVKKTPFGKYDFWLKNNNCQDWVDRVLDNYKSK